MKVPPLRCPQCGSDKCGTNSMRSVYCIACHTKTTKSGHKSKFDDDEFMDLCQRDFDRSRERDLRRFEREFERLWKGRI